jgi:hypothetical protein
MVSLAECNREIMELMFMLKAEIKMLRAGKFNNIHEASVLKSEKLKSLLTVMKNVNTTADSQKYKTHLLPQLARLKSLSIENGLLLRGIYNGVKSVRERILNLENSEAQVGAYGRKGLALNFSEEPASHEKIF